MSEENKGGRPSKYKPEYCEQLVEHMNSGLSFESFAAIIDVNQDTLHEWVKVHEEFSEAKKRAYTKNLLFWEKLGVDHVLNESIDEENFEEGTKKKVSKSLNAAVWCFNMKNRHKWRDKQPDENDQININFTLAEKMAKARNRTGK